MSSVSKRIVRDTHAKAREPVAKVHVAGAVAQTIERLDEHHIRDVLSQRRVSQKEECDPEDQAFVGFYELVIQVATASLN